MINGFTGRKEAAIAAPDWAESFPSADGHATGLSWAGDRYLAFRFVVRGRRYGTLPGMSAGLRVHHGGSGEPVLLLLHGLGATGDVWNAWRPLLDRRWPGRWLAPDLPGHGGSRPLPTYTFDCLAAAVADTLGEGAPVVVLGHSLGGVVGLTLAGGGFAVPVAAVIGLGIKVAWTGEELGRAQAAAQRPAAWFPSRDEAAARYLRVSGLAGLLTAAEPAVDAGLREQHGQWRLAMDPRVFAVGAPDMPQLLAQCQAPVTLARGERDAMNTDEQLTELGVATVTLPGLGHNAHVENPHLSSTLLDRIDARSASLTPGPWRRAGRHCPVK